MTQAESSNNSYFTLKNPSINNKPQPTTNNATTKSGLLNRRQQHASYLPQLELPSLPPLSQLLTTDKVKKENANPQLQQQQPTNTTTQAAAASDAAVAVAVAAGMMPPNMNYAQALPPPPPQQQQPGGLYYNNNNNATNNNMTQLIDPTAMDTMYNLQPNNPANSDPATTAAMVAAAAAAVGYGMPMPPNATTTQALMEGAPQLQQHPQLQHHHQQQQHQQRQRQLSSSSTSSAEKIYSFVAIPGTNQKKRPRRRYDEIERLYHCNWSGCTKAYGTLNHLNAHVSMQKHGPKRHPAEFKEMRKEWRRQKKEREARKKANDEAVMLNGQQQQQQAPPMMSHNFNHPFQPYGQLPAGTMSLNGFY